MFKDCRILFLIPTFTDLMSRPEMRPRVALRTFVGSCVLDCILKAIINCNHSIARTPFYRQIKLLKVLVFKKYCHQILQKFSYE